MTVTNLDEEPVAFGGIRRHLDFWFHLDVAPGSDPFHQMGHPAEIVTFFLDIPFSIALDLVILPGTAALELARALEREPEVPAEDEGPGGPPPPVKGGETRERASECPGRSPSPSRSRSTTTLTSGGLAFRFACVRYGQRAARCG